MAWRPADIRCRDAAHTGSSCGRACAIDAGLHVDTKALQTILVMNRFILTIAASLASAALLMLSVPAGAAGDEWSALQLLGTPSNR